MAEHPVLGVGIDVEEWSALDHLTDPAVCRAARRWLGDDELAWCAGQPSLREALLAVLCSKEAAFKAWGAVPAPHEVRLHLSGSARSGRAACADAAPAAVEVVWRASGPLIVALALATMPTEGSNSAGPALYH